MLTTGAIKGEVESGRYPGEWVAKITKEMNSGREVGVVTVVVDNRELFIVTVEWEYQ